MNHTRIHRLTGNDLGAGQSTQKRTQVAQAKQNGRSDRADFACGRNGFHALPFGNQAMQRLLATGYSQAKSALDRPQDVYAQEADRVAEAFARIPDPLVRKKSNPVHESNPLIQRADPAGKKEQINAVKTVSSGLAAQIQALRGGGQPLPADTRTVFENKMGYDFNGVRIHNDEKSSALARNMNAMAFTVGRDIYFGNRQFNDRSLTGQYLLAHELTHVAQQTGLPRKSRGLNAGAPDGRFAGLSPMGSSQENLAISRKYDGETIQCAFPWLIAAAVAALAAGGVYAWWAHNCLAPVEIPMYIATFGADYRSRRSGGFRRWYFDQTGRPLASRLWDAFGHCYVACAATQRCGATTAGIAGSGREFYREYIDAAPHDSYTQDTNNQALGRSFGSAGRNCEQACRDAALNGSLDLTAPLVSFWTPARGEYAATAAERRADQARLAEEARQRAQRELEARLRVEYESCLALELERPGGVPSEEEEATARETCRSRTGYPH